jgi:hypothetical protein
MPRSAANYLLALWKCTRCEGLRIARLLGKWDRRLTCRFGAVNEALTPPSHLEWQLQPVSCGHFAAEGAFMRSAITAGAAAALMLMAASAQAEKRIFIIANTSDGYGVDQCLAAGGECGKTVANSYCRSREFARAVTFRKVGRDDITGAIPVSGPGDCRGRACDNFVAIECSR